MEHFEDMRKNALEHAKKHHNNVYQEFSKLKDRVTKKTILNNDKPMSLGASILHVAKFLIFAGLAIYFAYFPSGGNFIGFC
jgi:hypothetical protein